MYDASTQGYSFSKNFFSDMGAYVARNGDPNYFSMILFAMSLTIVGITLYHITYCCLGYWVAIELIIY